MEVFKIDVEGKNEKTATERMKMLCELFMRKQGDEKEQGGK